MSEMTISVNGLQISVTDEAKKRAVLNVLGLSLVDQQKSIFDIADEPVELLDVADDVKLFEHTVNFLRIIGAHPEGVGYSDVMQAFAVTNPRAMGGRIAKTNRFLHQIGFAKGTVYKAVNTSEGRVWKPGRKLQEALGQLETALG